MSDLQELLVEEARYRLLEESLPRLRKCLNMMTDEEIWYRPNTSTVSAGNLVLHLCGNVKQWLISGLGDEPDNRNRQAEFDEKGPLPVSLLLAHLDELQAAIEKVVPLLKKIDLSSTRNIQGFEVTGVSVLVHVVEHFSYHVGQVTFMVKSRKDVDTGYYQNLDLDITN